MLDKSVRLDISPHKPMGTGSHNAGAWSSVCCKEFNRTERHMASDRPGVDTETVKPPLHMEYRAQSMPLNTSSVYSSNRRPSRMEGRRPDGTPASKNGDKLCNFCHILWCKIRGW